MSGFRHLNIGHLSRVFIPNAITATAIFAGYIAILETFQGQYTAAAGFILLACVLDMVDGRIARLMRATSDFGVQFDSLADMVNYGVAPALLFYFLYFENLGFIGIALSFVPVCCAAIRLARFNEEADPAVPVTHFVGLPTTIAALVLAGYVIFMQDLHPGLDAAPQAALLMLLTGLLMISQVQYEKSNILSLRYIRKTRRVMTGSLIVASLVLFPTFAFFAWGLLYILYGLTRSAIHTILAGADDDGEED
ncbi:MAG: CDP-diacylglycerol--serine O-phosphatidyltransferase [Anaerolineae bacterium]|nr:CDP-diacylglycerol--serine O-phosphatidyltransferase [Anaerolineae bacterium]